MLRFTLRQLSFLSATARHGGIAQAARQLGVSAPAVASALDKLEDALELKLFDRFPAQGLRLTRAGEVLAARAEALLAQADALDVEARDMAGGRRGLLRIGTYFAIAELFVLPAVLDLRRDHPGICVEVIEGDFPDLVAALDAGQVDALAVYDQGFETDRHEVELLQDVPPLVLLAASHPLARRDALSLADLAGVPYVAVITSGPGPSYLRLLLDAGQKLEVPFATKSRELAHAYVGKGLGYTLVGFEPKRSVTTEGDPVVVRPLLGDIGRFRAVLAVSRHVDRAAPVDLFREACRSHRPA
ncbi:MAG: LysR family transcriptional regulator [Proteobacteria bacterium]|nr:LysR family transcriptional regulator [Pseudomonadota bacterium]